MEPPSPLSTSTGVAVEFQPSQGQSCAATVTALPAEGVSIFPLSSVARESMVAEPSTVGVQVYDQEARPGAGCQVFPPSAETSTPATTPPPESVAVPEITTGVPPLTMAPEAGEVILEVGAMVSVDFEAGTR